MMRVLPCFLVLFGVYARQRADQAAAEEEATAEANQTQGNAAMAKPLPAPPTVPIQLLKSPPAVPSLTPMPMTPAMMATLFQSQVALLNSMMIHPPQPMPAPVLVSASVAPDQATGIPPEMADPATQAEADAAMAPAPATVPAEDTGAPVVDGSAAAEDTGASEDQNWGEWTADGRAQQSAGDEPAAQYVRRGRGATEVLTQHVRDKRIRKNLERHASRTQGRSEWMCHGCGKTNWLHLHRCRSCWACEPLCIRLDPGVQVQQPLQWYPWSELPSGQNQGAGNTSMQDGPPRDSACTGNDPTAAQGGGSSDSGARGSQDPAPPSQPTQQHLPATTPLPLWQPGKTKRLRASSVSNPYVRLEDAGQPVSRVPRDGQPLQKQLRATPSQRGCSTSMELMPWRQPRPRPSQAPAWSQKITFEVEIFSEQPENLDSDDGEQ